MLQDSIKGYKIILLFYRNCYLKMIVSNWVYDYLLKYHDLYNIRIKIFNFIQFLCSDTFFKEKIILVILYQAAKNQFYNSRFYKNC